MRSSLRGPWAAWGTAALLACAVHAAPGRGMVRVRFGQFNIRRLATQALLDPEDGQVRAAAEIIRLHGPDILSIDEIQYDGADAPDAAGSKGGRNARRFAETFLGDLGYGHVFFTPGNTGVPSGHPAPFDRLDYGDVPGQFGMALLSRYPIRTEDVVRFHRFRWRDLPESRIERADRELAARGEPPVPEDYPLFGKDFCDIPVEVDGRVMHVLLVHTTPPVFTCFNDERNADQIRFVEDYVVGRPLPGVRPLDPDAPFVVLGDLNCDPEDGDGYGEAVRRLAGCPRLIASFPEGAGRRGTNPRRNTFLAGGGVARPSLDPDGFQLQLDYILPSRHFAGPRGFVHWPDPDAESEAFRLARRASDHFLVVLDVAIPAQGKPPPAEAGRFRRGDCNADGRPGADMGDAIACLGAVFGGFAAPCLEACDANGDGRLDLADPIVLLGHIYAGLDPPPPPGPYACGTDPAPGLGPGCAAYPPCAGP